MGDGVTVTYRCPACARYFAPWEPSRVRVHEADFILQCPQCKVAVELDAIASPLPLVMTFLFHALPLFVPMIMARVLGLLVREHAPEVMATD